MTDGTPMHGRGVLCVVNPAEHGGGAEFQISLLIDTLAATGRYDIHYLTHFPDVRQRTRNYQVSRIGSGGPLPKLGYIVDGPALYRRLGELRPGLIYQRVGCAYTGVCGLYSQRQSVPLLWHVSSDMDVVPQPLHGGRNILRTRLEKWATEFGVRRATRIVVQTQAQTELLRRHYHRSADALIPNFHPPAAATIDKTGPLTVVWISNLKPLKRPESFIDLAQSLSDLTTVRFVMVGAIQENPGRRLESLMRSIESTSNLTYTGALTQAQVNDLLGRAHVLVNTSTHEGFPNTFIQAWLHDVAVVSLTVDPDKVFELERAGILAHTQAGLIGAVRKLLEDQELRSSYVASGRARARKSHSMANAQQLLALIDAMYRAPSSPRIDP